MWGGEGQIATLAVPIPHSLSSHPASPPSPRCRLIRSECWGYGTYFLFFIFAFSSSRLTTQHIRASFSEPDFSFFFFVGDIEMKKNLN